MILHKFQKSLDMGLNLTISTILLIFFFLFRGDRGEYGSIIGAGVLFITISWRIICSYSLWFGSDDSKPRFFGGDGEEIPYTHIVLVKRLVCFL